MALNALAVVLAGASLASAHFQIEYPQWRADTLSNSSYSQWVYPCGGVSPGAPGTNRTDWALTGGALVLDLHHPWTYIFVNLGLGEAAANFNYTLTPTFWNETGNGTLAISAVPLPAGLSVTDGTKASLQVVTLGASGQALYNCADITFRANATAPSTTTSPGVSFYVVGQVNSTTSTSSVPSINGSTIIGGATPASGGNGSSTTGKNAAGSSSVNTVVLASVAGLAMAFAFGIGF